MDDPLPNPVVEIRDLSRVHRTRDRTFEIYAPSIMIEAGGFYAVVGPSGSGKSTLLDMLALVRRPTAIGSFKMWPGNESVFDIGEIWRTGGDSDLADLRRSAIGYVLQTGGLLPFLNVSANVALPLKLLGARARSSDILKMLDEFGMRQHARKAPNQLSGGERQRVAVVRALAHNPALVLADEPTASVDRALARNIVLGLADRARSRGAAVVMVTHDEALVEGIADRRIRLVRSGEQADQVRYETVLE